MPKSKQRKNHKQKVQQRNDRNKKQWEIASKKAWEKFEEYKKSKESNNDTKNI